MKQQADGHRSGWTAFLTGTLLIVALASSACDGTPTRPTATAAPSPTPPVAAPPAPPDLMPGGPPTFLRYHVSGVVTDETGSPIAGAHVEVDYSRGGEFSSPPAFCPDGCWIATVTDGGGHYDIVFEPGLGPVHGTDTAGVIFSWHEGYENNIQLLPRETPNIVENLRLRRVGAVSAGQSIAVSIEPDSALCSDLEDLWILTSRCENVAILVGEAGTLTVEARAAEAGGIIPVVFFATSGRYTSGQMNGPGTASVGVEAGERYRVVVGIPSGMAGRYEVSTSLR